MKKSKNGFTEETLAVIDVNDNYHEIMCDYDPITGQVLGLYSHIDIHEFAYAHPLRDEDVTPFKGWKQGTNSLYFHCPASSLNKAFALLERMGGVDSINTDENPDMILPRIL